MYTFNARFFEDDCAKDSDLCDTVISTGKIPYTASNGTFSTYTPYDADDMDTILDRQSDMSDIMCALNEFEDYVNDIVLH